MNRSVMNVTNITVVVAFLAALGTRFLLRPTEEGSPVAPAAAVPAVGHAEQASALEEALTSLTAEVAALKREQDHLARSLRTTEATANRAVSLGVQAGTPPQAEEEAGAEMESTTGWSEEQKITATLYELDLRLSKEPDDPTWGQRAEMDIATLLHPDVMKGSQVLSANCQSILCRVEVEHTDGGAQGQFVDLLPSEPPFDGEMLVRQISDDPLTPRTLVYIARQGYPLIEAAPGTP